MPEYLRFLRNVTQNSKKYVILFLLSVGYPVITQVQGSNFVSRGFTVQKTALVIISNHP